MEGNGESGKGESSESRRNILVGGLKKKKYGLAAGKKCGRRPY